MLLLWFKAGKNWLPVMTFVLIFQAASLVNIGSGIGVSPAVLALVLLLVQSFTRKPSHKAIVDSPKPATIGLLALALAYSIVSAFLNPRLFVGVPVSNPRDGNRVSLAWETGHLNQVVYLVLGVALFYVVSCRTSYQDVRKAVDWFVGACVFAALITVYQVAGLPFPREIFATSPSYAIFTVYDIGNFTRANSTFTEASAASSTFVVALAIVLWRTLSGGYSTKNLVLCGVLLVGIILTLSTTGYLCLAFLLVVSFYRYFSFWGGSSYSRTIKPLLAIPLLLAFLSVAMSEVQRDRFSELLDSVVLKKGETASYRERTQANDDAWQSAAATSWLGAGFGVCRGSSVIPTTFGNIGVPGVGLFFLFLLFAVWPSVSVFFKPARVNHQSILLGLSTCLVGLVIAGPEMTSALLWFFIGAAAKRPRSLNPVRVPAYRVVANPVFAVPND